MSTSPITCQAQADEARAAATRRVAANLNLPIDEAARRVEGLFKSGILDGKRGHPDTKLAISAFLSVPSTSYTIPK